jgi:hypothetical protein
MDATDLYDSLTAISEKTVYEAEDGECFDAAQDAMIYNLMLRVDRENIRMDVAAACLRIIVDND